MKRLSEEIKRRDEIIELFMAASHPREAFEMIGIQFHRAPTIANGIGVKFQSIVRQTSLIPSLGELRRNLE